MKILLSKKIFACIVLTIGIIITSNAQITNPLKRIFHQQLNENITHPQSLGENNFKGTQTKNAPPIQWQKCIGGTRDDYAQNAIIKLRDGNFLTCGSTNSHNGDFDANHGKYDAFLMKTDGKGNILWEKTYGGSGNDALNNMIETSNGDVYAIGNTTSNDGQVSGNHGGAVYGDIWLIKTNSNGKLLSQRCYGGSGDEWTQGLMLTKQGNLVFPAATNSNDGDIPTNHGDYDGWIVKLKASGAIDFSVIIGDTADDELYTIAEINGNILVGGETSIKNAYDPDVAKYYDAIVAKIDQKGNIIYFRKYGGSGSDNCNSLVTSSDGNAVLVGHTSSHDGDVPHNNGFDMWIWKIDVAHNGNIIWQNFIGVPKDTAAGFNLTQTHDGGFVIVGGIAPNLLAPYDTWDVYAAKVNAHGKILWTKKFGGSNFDIIFGVVEENDKSILIGGATGSNDGDVSGNHGGPEDAWMVDLGRGFGNDDAIAEESDLKNSILQILKLSNYPNPFTASTTVSFTLLTAQKVTAQIFDKKGTLIKILADENMYAGTHQLIWNARDINGNTAEAGVYLLRMQAGTYVETKKIVVLK